MTDISVLMFIFQKRSKAQTLLDKVFDHLELIEKDYFGLQFADVAPAPDAMVCFVLLVGHLAAPEIFYGRICILRSIF